MVIILSILIFLAILIVGYALGYYEGIKYCKSLLRFNLNTYIIKLNKRLFEIDKINDNDNLSDIEYYEKYYILPKMIKILNSIYENIGE